MDVRPAPDDRPAHGRSSQRLEVVCELAAMPGWLRLNHGCMEWLLERSGFTVDSVDDATDRVLPMLRAFSSIGRFPYLLGRALGRRAKVVNALSGVEMYRHQDAWRYRIYAATKR